VRFAHIQCRWHWREVQSSLGLCLAICLTLCSAIFKEGRENMAATLA